jgi:uncharacterized repeat protein (TIGR01451 family)
MYDGVLTHQKYFSGKDSISVPGNTTKTVSMPLPTCMAQIDMYGTSIAPRQLLAEYGAGAGPPFMGAAFHLNKAISYLVPDGPLCSDVPQDNPPVGNFDAWDCTNIVGWAADVDVPNQTLDVHVYREAPAGQAGAVFLGSFKADQPRPDVNSALQIPGNHGFVIPTPSSLKDGQFHKLYIYAINPISGKVNPLLPGSPKTLSCATPPVTECKLELAKSVDKQSANVGDELTYSLSLKNTGSANCTGNVRLEDTYDSGVTFVRESHSNNVVRGYAATNTPFHNVASRTLTWDANVLSPNETAQVTWVASVNDVAQCSQVVVKNQARVTAAEYNNLQTWVSSSQVSTNVSRACLPPPSQQTDLGVTKTVSPSLITVGQTATFTVTVTNNGPVAATSAILTDVLPAGLTLVSFSVSQGSFNRQTGVWALGGLAVGQHVQLTLVARGESVGTKLNTATLTEILPSDTNPNNNQAQASVTIVAPPTPDVVCAPSSQTIYINQTANLAAVGGNGTYVWSGPDASPSNGSGATYSPLFSTTGEKTIVVTSGGKQASCTVLVIAVPVVVNPLDLVVAKQVSPALIQVGQTTTFTVTVLNRTSVPAGSVRLTDILPVGLSFVTQSVTQGNYTAATGVWDVGSLASGASASAFFQVTGGAGSYTNTATLTNSSPADTDSTNNSASATLVIQAPGGGGPSPLTCSLSTNTVLVNQVITAYASGGAGNYTWSAVGGLPANGAGTSFSTGYTTAGQYAIVLTSSGASVQCPVTVLPGTTVTEQRVADLSVRKSVRPESIPVAAQGIFAITVANAGPAAAEMVTLKDLLPQGLVFVSATTSRGSYAADSGIWTIGTVAAGEELTLLITVKAERVGNFVNTAEIWTNGVFDPDSTPGNSNPSEDDQASATLTVTGGLVSAGLPTAPLSIFAFMCVLAALVSVRIKTQRQIRLQTPVGAVQVEFE